MCTFNIICKREKRIRSQRNTCQLIQPCTLLFSCEYYRFFSERFLPVSITDHIHVFLTHININRVITFCTGNTLFKRQIQYLWTLAQPPVVCFLSGQTGTVYTGLLSGAYTDGLSVFYETYRVRLGVFEDDQRNLHISLCLFGQFFVICHQIGNQFIINCQFLSSLFKSNTKHFFMFQWSRYIIRINLNHIIISFFLLRQNLQSFRCITRCNYTVRYLSLDQQGGIFVAYVRQRNKITERRHTVCTSCSCVSTGNRREVFPVHIIYPVDFCQCLT